MPKAIEYPAASMYSTSFASNPTSSTAVFRFIIRKPTGMMERFNGRISDVVNQTRYGSAAELESTLRNYVKIYNHSILQRGTKAPNTHSSAQNVARKKPELFAKRVHNHTGLEKYAQRP